MVLKLTKNKLAIIILLTFATFLYGKVLNGFFQQDEWATFGWYILHGNLNLINTLKFLFAPDVGHYNPFTNVIQYYLFNLWGLDYTKFAILGILLNDAVVVGVYLLAKKIFRDNIFNSFITALIFSSFVAGYQGVSWVVVNTATLAASLLGIISAILFCDFIKNKKSVYLFFSITILLTSLLFKEITIGLFPLFFLIIFHLFHTKKLPSKYLSYILTPGILYLLLRISMFFAPNPTNDSIVTKTLKPQDLIYNISTIPFKSLSQIIIPQEILRNISRLISSTLLAKLSGTPETTRFDLFVTFKVMEPLSIALALTIIVLTFILTRKRKKLRIISFLAIAWILFNSLIYSFSPGTNSILTLVDSRNMYFPSIGAAFLIITLLQTFKKKYIKYSILVLILIVNIYLLNKTLNNLSTEGNIRKKILNQISQDHQTLPKKTIFFIESDSSFYGLPEDVKILPFQSGFGQTLLVWYYPRQKFPTDFFKDNFLWELKAQGYKEENGIGFGYFRDLDLLKVFVRQNKFNLDNVIGYSYNSKNQTLTGITKDLDKELMKYEIK